MDEETVSFTPGLTSSINYVNSSRLLSDLILDQAESKPPPCHTTLLDKEGYMHRLSIFQAPLGGSKCIEAQG